MRKLSLTWYFVKIDTMRFSLLTSPSKNFFIIFISFFLTTAVLFCINYFVVLENLESSLKKGSSDEAFSTLLTQLRTTNLENRLEPNSDIFFNVKIREMFDLVDTIIRIEIRDKDGDIKAGVNNNESLKYLAATYRVESISPSRLTEAQLSLYGIFVTELSQPIDSTPFLVKIYFFDEEINSTINSQKNYLFFVTLVIFLTQLSLFFFYLKFAFRAAQDTNTKLEKVNRLLENKNVQLEYAASHDSLTTIPNRAALIDYLHRKLEKMKSNDSLYGISKSPLPTMRSTSFKNREKFALCFIDIDKFKPINDKYGHLVGDGVLIEIANRIQKASRPKDFFGRLGGDEFIVILNQIKNITGTVRIIERIQRTLSEPMKIQGSVIRISCIIGIGVYVFDESLQTSKILNEADSAMYKVKSKGGGSYSFYNY